MSKTSQIISLIDKAIDDGRLDRIIANKWVEGTPPVWERKFSIVLPPPNQYSKAVKLMLAGWLQCRLAPILEALGKNNKARDVFANLLHRPWDTCKDNEPCLLDLSEPERSKRAEQLVVRATCASLRDRLARYAQAGEVAEKRPLHKTDRCADAFWGNPAAWLWSVWNWWEIITGCKALPERPDWDGLREHQFYARLPGSIAFLVKSWPGEVADNLKLALEKLRERLTAAEVQQPESKSNPTLRKAAAFIRRHSGSNAAQIAEHCDIEPNSFRTHIAPKLKKQGFTSLPGCAGGYYPPHRKAK